MLYVIEILSFRSGNSDFFREELLFCCKRMKVWSEDSLFYQHVIQKIEDLFMRNIFFLDISLKRPLQIVSKTYLLS